MKSETHRIIHDIEISPPMEHEDDETTPDDFLSDVEVALEEEEIIIDSEIEGDDDF